jgi:hypothetical protein
MQRMFPEQKKHEVSFDGMVTQMQNEFERNPELAAKAKRLYDVVLAVNKQAEVSEQKEVNEPESPWVDGLRNRKSEYPQTASHSNLSVFSKASAKVAAASAKNNNNYQAPSFAGHMSKTYLSALLGPIGLLLGATAAAADLPSGLMIESGSNGGTDLCSGLVWCIQAALKNVTDGSIVAQFSRDFGLTGGKGSFITEIALGTCFGQGHLSSVMEQVLDAVPDWYDAKPSTCSGLSDIWNSVQQTGSATHLSVDGCLQFQSAFAEVANSCENAEVGARVFGIGLGISLGAIVACVMLAACAYGSYALYKECRNR